MSEPPDQTDMLRELIENLDEFRNVVTDTLKYLHRQQRAFKQQLDDMKAEQWILRTAALIVMVALLIYFVFVVR